MDPVRDDQGKLCWARRIAGAPDYLELRAMLALFRTCLVIAITALASPAFAQLGNLPVIGEEETIEGEGATEGDAEATPEGTAETAPEAAAEAPADETEDILFTLYNISGSMLVGFTASPAGEGAWGEDLLGGGVISDGNEGTIDFPGAIPQCNFDFLLVLDDEREIEDSVDVCESNIYVIEIE